MLFRALIFEILVIVSKEQTHNSRCSRIPYEGTNMADYIYEICIDQQRQISSLDNLSKSLLRVESQRQDLSLSMDRSETRLGQRIDSIKGDLRQILTLQEIFREEMEKLHGEQPLTREWLESQFLKYFSHLPVNNNKRIKGKQNTSTDCVDENYSTEILTSLHTIQNAVLSLRRMMLSLQSDVRKTEQNITILQNITRTLDTHVDNLVTKQYLLNTLKSIETSRKDSSKELCETFDETVKEMPKDCQEVLSKQAVNESGVYLVKPRFMRKPIFVYCDMETDGGGWTIFQRRKDGATRFQRTWQEYKNGFGNINAEFWLGNDNLHYLTLQDVYELRVDLYDFESGHANAVYEAFGIAPEKENYRMSLLGDYSGNAGDSMIYHAGIPFSTADNDNDFWSDGNCAVGHLGGWWYNNCAESNLNGMYLGGQTEESAKGVFWLFWKGHDYSLNATTMMIRPKRKF